MWRRFVEKQQAESLAETQSALDPEPLAGKSVFKTDNQPKGVNNRGLKRILPEDVFNIDNRQST